MKIIICVFIVLMDALIVALFITAVNANIITRNQKMDRVKTNAAIIIQANRPKSGIT